jgi:3-oxoacyl-[acyl-carrier-protein] synthase II
MARAICQALRQAGAHPGDVGHYSAHATSTPRGDAAEARAIRKALGSDADNVPVTAIKGGLGHLLGAAGTIQAIITVCSLAHGLVPPIRNLDQPDDAADLCLVRGAPRAARPGMALTAAAGFGGANVVLAFGACAQ